MRREEAAQAQALAEEKSRKQLLLAKRQRFAPIEFLGGDVELPAEWKGQLPPGVERDRVAPKAERSEAMPALPPIKQYYKGPSRDKVPPAQPCHLVTRMWAHVFKS